MSPLSAPAETDAIISITAAAHEQIITMRDGEPETDRLGLRLEIVSDPGEEFRYDLSFEITTKAAFTDEVRTHDGLKVIIPAKDIELLTGATLDFTSSQGLVIRNPNKPAVPSIEGLVRDDQLSAEVEALVAAEVNPSLAAHGGFVTFVGHDTQGTAYMTMGGGCHGCSMSRMTMLEGVQAMLVEQVAGIDRVKDLTDHSTGATPFYN
ncbi:MAG: nfuA [Ilumatobacteraceae bacterium]|nr:nfuA [Ilumatobacteraceae bacterium]MCU1391405.1 nfuA [Ilumatobacteraceae bacterium]